MFLRIVPDQKQRISLKLLPFYLDFFVIFLRSVMKSLLSFSVPATSRSILLDSSGKRKRNKKKVRGVRYQNAINWSAIDPRRDHRSEIWFQTIWVDVAQAAMEAAVYPRRVSQREQKVTETDGHGHRENGQRTTSHAWLDEIFGWKPIRDKITVQWDVSTCTHAARTSYDSRRGRNSRAEVWPFIFSPPLCWMQIVCWILKIQRQFFWKLRLKFFFYNFRRL